MKFDRKVFFDTVRGPLFGGSLTGTAVAGMEAILTAWEAHPRSQDLRWLAYCFATTFHETAKKMQPIKEFGLGNGMAYGKPDPKTGQTYYGRGDVQLTWAENYKRADSELGLTGDASLYLHADNALKPDVASEVMFQGMTEGWFRKGHTLARYFSDTADNPFEAREIINGDKNTVPKWSGGVSIGKLIAGYHGTFLKALKAAKVATEDAPTPTPVPVPEVREIELTVTVAAPAGVKVNVRVVQES